MKTGTLSRPSSPALAQSSSTLSSMASPTNTTARTPEATASRRASDSTLPIWVLPPRQSILPISLASCALSEIQPDGAALVEAAIIDQADVETAERGRLAKHVGLQRAGHVPGRLPAHGRIEREDQPAPGARRMRRHRARLGDEGGDVLRGGRLRLRQRPALPDAASCVEDTSPEISVWSVRRTSALANCSKLYVGRDREAVNARDAIRPLDRARPRDEADGVSSEAVPMPALCRRDRHVGRNRPGVGHRRRRVRLDRP